MPRQKLVILSGAKNLVAGVELTGRIRYLPRPFAEFTLSTAKGAQNDIRANHKFCRYRPLARQWQIENEPASRAGGALGVDAATVSLD